MRTQQEKLAAQASVLERLGQENQAMRAELGEFKSLLARQAMAAH